MLSFVKSFGIPTPLVYFVNLDNSSIMMQEIPGKPVHDLADSKIIESSKTIGKLNQFFSTIKKDVRKEFSNNRLAQILEFPVLRHPPHPIL